MQYMIFVAQSVKNRLHANAAKTKVFFANCLINKTKNIAFTKTVVACLRHSRRFSCIQLRFTGVEKVIIAHGSKDTGPCLSEFLPFCFVTSLIS